MKFETTTRRWEGETIIVAASGPSLSKEVAALCQARRLIAVSDAYKLFPNADVLYSADAAWWRVHNGAPSFRGEKWTTANASGRSGHVVADEYGLRVINGKAAHTFSTQADMIHFGGSSGFQALNLAILWGAARIIMIGYNMQNVSGQYHFFGKHVAPLHNSDPRRFIPAFDQAAKQLKANVEIINATPQSALKCFPLLDLRTALALPPKERMRATG